MCPGSLGCYHDIHIKCPKTFLTLSFRAFTLVSTLLALVLTIRPITGGEDASWV